MLDKLISFFISLRLTVVCLAYAMVLVFIGTLAQVDEGLYAAQARYFKSWLIFWPVKFPVLTPGSYFLVLPGGYFVGGLLMVNLVMSYVSRFKLTRENIGLTCIHIGLVLLLVGQLGTDFFARESSMRLVEGQERNYSESFDRNELVLIDTSSPNADQVTAIPESLLGKRKEIQLPGSPLVLQVKQYWPNADLLDRPAPGGVKTAATKGLGADWQVQPKPAATRTDERNVPSAVIEVRSGNESLGAWLVSCQFSRPQTFTAGGKSYQLALRFVRNYYPFSITLQKFNHDKYPGTDIPRNFSSEIRLVNRHSGEDRPVLIRMNEPLRYQSTTFYQGSYDPNDPKVSILQVVRNPGWLTPYISCILVGLGLTIQFMSHLIRFAHQLKSTPSAEVQVARKANV